MLEKLFGFDRKVTSVRTEVMAGITTCARCRYGSGTDSGGSDDDGGCAENRLHRLFRSYPGFHLHPVYAVGLQHFGRYRIGNDRLCAD